MAAKCSDSMYSAASTPVRSSPSTNFDVLPWLVLVHAPNLELCLGLQCTHQASQPLPLQEGQTLGQLSFGKLRSIVTPISKRSDKCLMSPSEAASMADRETWSFVGSGQWGILRSSSTVGFSTVGGNCAHCFGAGKNMCTLSAAGLS